VQQCDRLKRTTIFWSRNENTVLYSRVKGVTLNNASDYRTNGHYRTPNPNPKPNPNPSSLVR